MKPLCSAFTAADKTDALAAGNIAKMILQQWVGTNVALWCCRMNMPLAGRAKFANCNAHEDKKVISKQLSKLCVPKLRRAAQGKGNCSRMRTRSCSRERAAQTEGKQMHSPPGCLSRLPNTFVFSSRLLQICPWHLHSPPGCLSRLPLYRCRRSMCQSQPTADAAHDENKLPDKKELRREGAASRALPTICSGGV